LIVIEHVMKVITELSNRILVLHHGEKIMEGSPDRVMNDKQVIEAYLGKRQRVFVQQGCGASR
jgi:branched-chain amino acid transport system ATP-binding protein